jgi:hypothetical protein
MTVGRQKTKATSVATAACIWAFRPGQTKDLETINRNLFYERTNTGHQTEL